MSLLDGILKVQAERFSPSPKIGLARFLTSSLSTAEPVREIVLARAQMVAKYAVRKEWPKFEKRFKVIANNGLVANAVSVGGASS